MKTGQAIFLGMFLGVLPSYVVCKHEEGKSEDAYNTQKEQLDQSVEKVHDCGAELRYCVEVRCPAAVEAAKKAATSVALARRKAFECTVVDGIGITPCGVPSKGDLYISAADFEGGPGPYIVVTGSGVQCEKHTRTVFGAGSTGAAVEPVKIRRGFSVCCKPPDERIFFSCQVFGFTEAP